MRELPSRAVVYASSPAEGLITFDTKGERRDESAAFAARCSAAIPYFFTPQRIGDHRVYDGGVRDNFPFKRFVWARRSESDPFAARTVIHLGA